MDPRQQPQVIAIALQIRARRELVLLHEVPRGVPDRRLPRLVPRTIMAAPERRLQDPQEGRVLSETSTPRESGVSDNRWPAPRRPSVVLPANIDHVAPCLDAATRFRIGVRLEILTCADRAGPGHPTHRADQRLTTAIGSSTVSECSAGSAWRPRRRQQPHRSAPRGRTGGRRPHYGPPWFAWFAWFAVRLVVSSRSVMR